MGFLKKQNIKIGIFLLLTMAIYFSFGLNHLGKFITADEHLWIYSRIPKYWTGIMTQQWEKTYVHEKPGITLSIISGSGLAKYNYPKQYIKENNPSVTQQTSTVEKFLIYFRMPILLFNGIFSLYFFWVLKKITKNKWVALWSAILILLSPILIGISQIVNSDSLLWVFSTATILSYIAYLTNGAKKFVLLTALFLGLSLLTKFTATILLPFLFAIGVVYYLENYETLIKKINAIIKVPITYILIVIGALLEFAVLMPASIVKPKYLYKGTVGYSSMEYIFWPIFLIQILIIIDAYFFKNKTTLLFLKYLKTLWHKCNKLIYLFLIISFSIVLANYIIANDWLGLEKIPFDSVQDEIFDSLQGGIFVGQSLINKILLEFRPIVFSITPLVLFFTLYTWILSIKNKIKEKFLIIVISAFIPVFIFAVIQQDLLSIIRYSIAIYPLLAIIAAVGIDHLLNNGKNGKFSRSLVTIIIIIASFISLWQTKPYYFNYMSDILPKKYIIADAWGYGGYEIAQYLNSLSDAKSKFVWSDYYGVCDFYIGTCSTEYNINQTLKPVDYFVLTRRGRIRYISKKIDKGDSAIDPNFIQVEDYYDKSDPLKIIKIGDRPQNYIKVYPKQ